VGQNQGMRAMFAVYVLLTIAGVVVYIAVGLAHS
jgi:hypothetical protein